MSDIHGYHAHVYFDQTSLDSAIKVCRAAGKEFELTVGHFHEQPVGPHPCWSCQLSFAPQQFDEVMAWLALNRQGLTVFIHPNTGDHYKDHTDHAIWMGEVKSLNLSVLKASG